MGTEFNDQSADYNFNNIILFISPDHVRTVFQWLGIMSGPKLWDLSEYELAKIVGLTESEFTLLSNFSDTNFSSGVYASIIERVNLLYKLWTFLKALVPGANLACAAKLFSAPGLVEGASLKQLLLSDNSIDNLYFITNSFQLSVSIISIIEQ